MLLIGILQIICAVVLIIVVCELYEVVVGIRKQIAKLVRMEERK
jgi:hypothetical protein